MWEGGTFRQFIPRADVSIVRLIAMRRHIRTLRIEGAIHELADIRRRIPLSYSPIVDADGIIEGLVYVHSSEGVLRDAESSRESE